MSKPAARMLIDKEKSAPFLDRMKRLKNDFPLFRDLYRDMLKNFPSDTVFLKVDEVSTDGTNYFWLTFKPTDRLLELMAAFDTSEVK